MKVKDNDLTTAVPRFILTTCPYCGCGCNFYLSVMEDSVIDVVPCKTHEVSRGELCIKGRNASGFVHSKDRLTKPLVRKNGELKDTTWKEAIDYVAKKLRDIKEKHGSDSIGVLSSAKCTNEENYIIQKFARVVIGTNNIDHCARLCHAPSVVALGEVFGSGAMTNSIPEIDKADCILVTGSNTIESHPMIGTRILQARRRGAKLIVIDPREVPLAKHADIYIRSRPGSDVAWLNGLAREILALGMEDMDFIKERTEGFEEFKKTVERYVPELVRNISGIPEYRLKTVAEMFASAERGMIAYAMGITQHVWGTENVKAIANLAMLTGNVGKEGTGVLPLRGQNNVQGSSDMGCLPTIYPGYQRIDDKEAAEKFEDAWGTKLSRKVGLTVTEMLEHGRLRGMYIVGEEPMMTEPNIRHTRKGLESLEFLVVQDIFPTETAKLADVVLPAASYAEKDGTFTATDRRVQRVRKAVPPPGEAKPDWEIVCLLARAMNSKGFDFTEPKEIMEEISSLVPLYGGITYERLDRDTILWPCYDVTHPGTKYLHSERFTRGKGKFSPVDYKEPAELPDENYPFLLSTGRLMFHYHSGTMTRRTELLSKEVETGYIEIHPEDAKKLNIISGEMVKVKSRRGEIELPALVTDRVERGVVFIPFHFVECAANVLTIDAVDPVAKIPEYKVCAVAVSKKEEGK